mmetsp:Transcript_11077/g.35271  ORF Transcript_11077/g.35271 Transcript_11077/m.35271 type:complete len:219 (-) Transcript_11077:2094-2750(-)
MYLDASSASLPPCRRASHLWREGWHVDVLGARAGGRVGAVRPADRHVVGRGAALHYAVRSTSLRNLSGRARVAGDGPHLARRVLLRPSAVDAHLRARKAARPPAPRARPGQAAHRGAAARPQLGARRRRARAAAARHGRAAPRLQDGIARDPRLAADGGAAAPGGRQRAAAPGHPPRLRFAVTARQEARQAAPLHDGGSRYVHARRRLQRRARRLEPL